MFKSIVRRAQPSPEDPHAAHIEAKLIEVSAELADVAKNTRSNFEQVARALEDLKNLVQASESGTARQSDQMLQLVNQLQARMTVLSEQSASAAKCSGEDLTALVGQVSADIKSLARTSSSAAEYLDTKIFERVGEVLGDVKSLAQSTRSAAEYIDTKMFERVGEVLEHVKLVNASTRSAAEYIDTKMFERTGGVAETVNVIRDAQTGAIAYNNAALFEIKGQLGRLIELQEIQSNRLLGRISTVATALDAQASAKPGGQGGKLYLDLLEAELTGTLHQDVSAAPWAKDKFDSGRREIGRDWPKTALTMIGSARMRNLRHLCEQALSQNVAGDFIETGVWRGGACIYMKGILKAWGDTERRVLVADSFRGLPPPDSDAFPLDAGDTHHTFDELAISRESVEANFRRFGLLDERVVFLEGWFKDTLHKAPIERLAVLRLDGDMYESTMQALDALYDKVSPGGFVIVDDYVLPACAEAVNDYRRKRAILAPMSDVDGAAVWWQVPR